NGMIPIEPILQLPEGTVNNVGKAGFFPNGNYTFKDDFTADKLDYRWVGLRGAREDFIETTKNGLIIHPFNVDIKETKPTSTLFYRQQHKNFSFSTTIDYQPTSEKDLAGIVAFQNEGSNY